MTRKILGMITVLAILAGTFGAALPVQAAAPPIIDGMTYDVANQVRGKEVSSASGDYLGTKPLVTDNNPLTTWYAAAASPNRVTLEINLVQSKTFGNVVVTFVNADSLKLSVRATDTDSWQLVGSRTWSKPVDGPVVFPMNGNWVNMQYIQVELGTSSGSPIGVSEVEGYGWVGYVPPTGVVGTTNIALNKPITSYEGTALPGYDAPKAVDGNLASEFRLTAGDTNNSAWGYLQVDLGAPYSVGRVTLDPRNAHWYRVMLRTLPDETNEKRVLNAFPENYGTATASSAQDEFIFWGSKVVQYIYLWTQLDRPPSLMESAVKELQVFTRDAPTAPQISVSQTIYSFETLLGVNPSPQNLIISNIGGQPLDYSVVTSYATPGEAWLTLSKSAGSLSTGTNDFIELTINAAGLAVGDHTANLSIGGNASNTANVAVKLKVGIPTISTSPASLAFNTDPGVSPASKSLVVTNSGMGILDFSIASSKAWLTAAPASGSAGAGVSVPVVVTANTAAASPALAPGTYNESLTITQVFNGITYTSTVPVFVTVAQPPAFTLITPASLPLGALPGGSDYGIIQFRNSGGGTLNWTASSNAAWLTISPPVSGALVGGGPGGEVNITASSTGLAAGTYNGTVTISATNPGVAPITVAVPFTISQLPVISTSAPSFSFVGTTDNATSQSVPLVVTNSGGGTLSFSVAVTPSTAGWLTVNPTAGSGIAQNGSVTLTVTVNPAGLTTGDRTANLVITPGAGTSPVSIPVSLSLSVRPVISLSASSITLYTTPGVNPPAPNLVISNSGGGILYWGARVQSDVQWLTVSVSSGNTTNGPSTITLNPFINDLVVGTRTGRVTVEAISPTVPGVSPKYCDVTIIVAPPPTVSVIPGSLDLTMAAGSATSASQLVSLTSSSPMTSNWSAISSAAWLTVSPASGSLVSGASSFTASASAAGLAADNYTATITLNLPGAATSQVTLPVTFTVTSVTPPPPPPGGNARGFKQSAVLAIQQVASQKRFIDNAIDRAVDYIQKSLKPAYWLDNSHLAVKDGDKVFESEKQAATHLAELAKRNKVPPEVSAAALVSLNDLVQADKILAQTAYDEAVTKVTSRRGKLLLQNAQEQMERAATELLSPKVNYAQAIDRYGQAWRYVQEALTAQDPPPPPPPAGDTARALKTSTMNALAVIQTNDKKVDKNLDSAVKNIGESLNPKFWIDGDYLNPKKGNKVFDNERQAAHDLMQVMADKNVSVSIKTIARLSAENLVAADKALATDAFNAARRYAGEKKVDKELADAAGFIVKARMEMGKASPDYRDAIQYYNKAWENTQQAIKYGTGHDKDKDDDDRDCDREWLKDHGTDRDRDKDRAGIKYWN